MNQLDLMGILVLVVVFGLSYLANAARSERHLHWWLPGLALLLGLGLISFHQQTFALWQWIDAWLPFPIVSRGLNFALLCSFIILKLFYFKPTSWLNRWWRRGSADTPQGLPLSGMGTLAYEQYPDTGISLRPRWVFVRDWTQMATVVAFLLCLYHMSGWAAQVGLGFGDGWPVLSLLLFSEMFWFLQGPFNNPAPDSITGENVRAQRESRFHNITATSTGKWGEVAASDSWLLAQGCYQSRLTSANTNYSLFVTDLHNGKNILLQDSSFDSLKPFLGPYLHLKRSSGSRLLILAPDYGYSDSARQWLSTLLDDPQCQASTFQERLSLSKPPDALISSPAEQLWLLPGEPEPWLREISTIIVLEAHSSLAFAGPNLRLVLEYFSRISDHQVQTIMLAEWRPNLEVALRNIIPLDFSAIQIYPERSPSDYLVWRHESPGKRPPFQREIVRQTANHFEPEVALALVPLALGHANVHLIGNPNFPHADNRSAIEDSLPQVSITQEAIASHTVREQLHYLDYAYQLRNSDYIITISRDSRYNLLSELYRLSAYGGQRSHIQVVSPPYLLRDYIVAQLPTVLNFRQAFESFAPGRSLPTRQWLSAYRLYHQLLQEPVPTQVIQQFLQQLSPEKRSHNFIEDLRQHLQDSLGIQGMSIMLSWQDKLIEQAQQTRIEPVAYLKLVANGQQPAWQEMVAFRSSNGETLNYIARGHLFQNYLENQVHSFNGRKYRIARIDVAQKVVEIFSVGLLQPSVTYRQFRHYRINRSGERLLEQPQKQQIGQTRLVLEHLELALERSIYGYLTLSGSQRLEDAAETRDRVFTDSYPQGKALRLQISLSEQFAARSEYIGFTLALLLQELSMSLYPESYLYLGVCPVVSAEFYQQLSAEPELASDRLSRILPRLEGAEVSSDSLCIYIIEDSPYDLNLLTSIEEQHQRIFNKLLKLLRWYSRQQGAHADQGAGSELTGSELTGSELTGSQLAAASEASGDAEPAPAHSEPATPEPIQAEPPRPEPTAWPFGYLLASEVDLLDLPATQAVLEQLATSSLEDPVDGQEAGVLAESELVCDFCGARINTAQYRRFEDQRLQCQSCSDHAVDTLDALQTLYERCRALLIKRYGLNRQFPGGIKVQFISAEELHARIGSTFQATDGFDPRPVGVAIKDAKGDTILIENGAPRHCIMDTLAHELTHIWQFNNLSMDALRHADSDLIEGHAVWVGLDYLRQLQGADVYFDFETYEQAYLYRNDTYGRGYRKMKELLAQGPHKQPFSLLKAKYAR